MNKTCEECLHYWQKNNFCLLLQKGVTWASGCQVKITVVDKETDNTEFEGNGNDL